MIDGQGRIVFDSSDDAGDISAVPKSRQQEGMEEDDEDADAEDADVSAVDKTATLEEDDEDVEIDLASLGARYFPDLGLLDELDVCPSLKTFDLGDPSGSMDIPFLKAPDDWRQDKEEHDNDGSGVGNKSGMFIDDENLSASMTLTRWGPSTWDPNSASVKAAKHGLVKPPSNRR